MFAIARGLANISFSFHNGQFLRMRYLDAQFMQYEYEKLVEISGSPS